MFIYSLLITVITSSIQLAADPQHQASQQGLHAASLLMGLLMLLAILSLGFALRNRARNSADNQQAKAELYRFKHLLDAIPTPLFYKDVAGRYLGCNKAFEAVLGKSREEIVGRTVYDVAPSDLAAIYHQADLELIASRGEQMYEAKVAFSDGQRHDILFHKAVFADESGEADGLIGAMLDITQIKNAERHLAQSEERHSAFVAMSRDGIWCGELDPPLSLSLPLDEQIAYIIENLKVAECNNALAAIYGYAEAKEMVGRRMREFYDVGHVQEVLERFIKSGYSLKEYESRQYDRSGNEIWVASSLSAVIAAGEISRLWGVRRDITEKKRYLEALEHQANHDSLTGLPNRFYLKKKLDAELEMIDDHGQLALFILDLDRFKEVNDTLGHHAGDLVLIELAKRLKQVLAGLGGELARLGGDEFAIIYTRVRNERDIFWLAEIVIKTMRAPFDVEGIMVEIEGSLGIALAPEHGVQPANLLRCADVSMYRAKKEKRRYALYSKELDPYTPERLALMNDLGSAVRSNQLDIYFQPKIRLADGEPAGFEALVRWNHPEKGLLMPADFIPFAEIGELIVPLTYQVIEKAVRQLRKWSDQGINTAVACNLSPRLLMDEDLPYHVEAFLKNYGVNPAALEFEITETALILEPERARDILNRISDMGIRLSIDDFGTGYSSLALLKSLPLNALKIDIMFVRHMLSSERDAIIVTSTINLAHNLGLKVVAEGVETPEILLKLREMGCDEAQGYYIEMPMCSSIAEEWLTRKEWKKLNNLS